MNRMETNILTDAEETHNNGRVYYLYQQTQTRQFSPKSHKSLLA